MSPHRLVPLSIAVAGLVGAGLVGSLPVGLAAPTAENAPVTLSVITDSPSAPVHPGDTTNIGVTVMTDQSATTGPVTVRLSAHRGRVVAVDNLGYPVDCTVTNGVGRCQTEAPLGAGHSFELTAAVKIGPRLHSHAGTTVTTMTALARSPADGAAAADTASILVTPADS